MANEFVIKNGFISKDNSIVEGGLTANTINASGININGNLTVTGNTSLQSISGTTLDISGNTSSNIVKITQTGSGNAFVVEDDTNPDSTPFVIDASGNTGIGTTTPQYKLDVSGSSRVLTSMRVGADGNTFTSIDDNSIGISRTTDGLTTVILEAPTILSVNRQIARLRGREGVQLAYDTFARFQTYQFTSTIGLASTFDTNLTNDISTILRLEGTKTPLSAVARGANFVPTLSATSDNDTLIGLDINPTFQNSSFTGVTNLGLRVNGNTILGTTTGDTTTFGNGIIFNYNVNPRIFAGDTIIYQSNNTSRQHYFVNDISSGLGGTIVEIGNGSGTLSTTTNNNFLNISGRLVSTSGANDSNAILISSQVGNGGTYSGVTRGLYYNPSIIGSGFTHRAIETTTGDVIFGSTSGNVGIGLTGTITPTAKLHINNTTSGNTFLAEDDTNPDSSPFVIDASGNTGIGTLTPSAKLDVVGGNVALNNNVLYLGSNLGNQVLRIVESSNLQLFNSVGILYLNAGNSLVFGSNNSNAGRWATFFNTGNLLLQSGGTHTDAGFKLDVIGNTRVSGNTIISSGLSASTVTITTQPNSGYTSTQILMRNSTTGDVEITDSTSPSIYNYGMSYAMTTFNYLT